MHEKEEPLEGERNAVDLEQQGFEVHGLIYHRCFSINTAQYWNVFSLSCDFPNNLSFSLASFVVTTQCIITYTKYTLLMSSVRLLVTVGC